jgi:4-amino-4-deoxy-L-arabinose transferase-like glycosyltransferase
MSTQTLPTIPAQAERAPAPVHSATPWLQSPRAALLIALGIFTVALFLNTFRSMETIDLNADEATYAIESVALQQTGMTRWNGTPFFVHPPVYFLIEGLYFKVRDVGQSAFFQRLVDQPYHFAQALLPPTAPLGTDNITNAIAVGRFLPALYGALIAVLLFLLGRAFLSPGAGALAAVLFMVDPYVLRRNHFNMLEPLATLFGILMIYIYYRGLEQGTSQVRRRYLIGAGLVLGLALLSKELAGLYIIALGVYALLFRRARLREVLLPVGIGLGLYLLFPIWAAATGNWSIWWASKTWLIQRLTGQIQDTGITRPGSTVGRFPPNLLDYIPAFFVLGVAGLLAALFLYLYFREGVRDRPAELLAALTLGCYAFFAAVGLAGGVLNEQFFYFIMPISILMVAYAALHFPQLWAGRGSARPAPRPMDNPYATRPIPLVTGNAHAAPTEPLPVAAGAAPRTGMLARIALVIVGLLGLYNLGAAIVRYGFSRDDSYVQVDSYLARTVPAGTPVVGRDSLDMYLLPRNPVYVYGFFPDAPHQIDPAAVIQNQIPYTVLNDQSVLEGYGGANPGYYEWVRQSGSEVYHFAGRTWNTSVYHLDYSRLAARGYEGASLAAHHPAVASSSENAATLGPDKAFDTLATTRWSSAESDNQWIYVDLGTVTPIHRVQLTWEAAYAQSYELQVSDNAQDWTTVYHMDQGQGGVESIKVAAQGRYVRLLLKKRATQYGYSLWEIGIYP